MTTYDCLECLKLNRDYEGAPLLCNFHLAKMRRAKQPTHHTVGSHGLPRKDAMAGDAYVKEK